MPRYFVYAYIEYNGAVTDKLGTDGRMQLDGRLSRYNMKLVAREWAKKHGYVGYRIERQIDNRFGSVVLWDNRNLLKGGV